MAKINNSQLSLFARLLEIARGCDFQSQLLRGGIGSFAIKVLSTLLAFGVAVMLARLLGPEGYGIYAYVFALISILAVPAQFGLPTLVVRETAKAHINERWDVMIGIWRWSNLMAAALSLVLGLVAAGLGWFYADHLTEIQLTAFLHGLLLIPLVALGNIRGAALRGLRKVVAGQLPESVLRPALLILLAWVTGTVQGSSSVTVVHVINAHILAALGAFLVGAWMLRVSRPSALICNPPPPTYNNNAWLKATLPLALLAGIQLTITYTDIIMLGYFRPAEEVGIYSVAAQGAMLVVFGQQAVNVLIATHFARLYAADDAQKMASLVTAGSRASILLALPVVLVFFLIGDKVLAYFFGQAFAAGYVPLAILSAALLLNAKFGLAAHLLNMTNHEQHTMQGMAMAAVINVILNFLLIPPFGIVGAAIATAVSLIVWTLLLCRSVVRVLGRQYVPNLW